MQSLLEQRGTWIMLAGLGAQLGNELAAGHVPALVTRVLGFGVGAILVYGGTETARAKGYTPWVGFLALLSFLGVGFLLMFPNPRYAWYLRWLVRKPDPVEAGDAGNA